MRNLLPHATAPSFFFSALLNALRKKPPSPQLLCLQKQRFSSAPSGARTLDTLIKSQVLYQLS